MPVIYPLGVPVMLPADAMLNFVGIYKMASNVAAAARNPVFNPIS